MASQTTARPQGTDEHGGRGCGCGRPGEGCGAVGELTRLRYFHGQPLGALDLRREQAYHLDKDRLRNRLLHGWGIVCGLEVAVAEKRSCRPGAADAELTGVTVLPGAAIDCEGREILVRRPRPVCVARLLGEAELEGLRREPATVYLTLCYHELHADPMRPMLAHGCDPAPDCEYGRVVETYRICATTTAPDRGPECEPCCGACGDPCLELGAIRDFDPSKPLRPEQLDLGGRRRLALHPFAAVTEINWVHGATYSRDDVNALLDDGLEFRLSRPVRVATLRPGVVELTGVDAGGGRSGNIYAIQGEFVGLPTDELVDRFVFRRTTAETLQYGDRLLITLRGDFVLDECCRALDGNHVGGAVPASAAATYRPVGSPYGSDCPPRPSGNGVEGGDFVSWISVADRGDRT
jgi:hypothetical protein